MLSLGNQVQFNEGLDKWFADVKELADGALRGLAVTALKFVVEETAQWTGNLAASWSLSVDNPVALAETMFKDLEPPVTGVMLSLTSGLHKGSPVAVNAALQRAKADGALGLISIGRPVWIATGVPYADYVERDRNERMKQFLRGVNLQSEMVHRAKALLKQVGRISEAQAQELGRKHL